MKLSNRKYRLALFVLLASVIGFSQVLWLYNERTRDLHALNDKQFIAHLDHRIPKLIEDYPIPGVGILLIKGGREVWSGTYGYADKESGRRLTSESIMMMQSISKSVSAWGVMKLVEDGRIGLDDPVARYLPSWSFPKSQFSSQKVTIRHLLSHSAGVEYPTENPTLPLERSLTNNEVHLVREPGLTFSYSNSGFDVLQLLVEKITGRDFGEYMEKQVLKPLAMHSSRFGWSEELKSNVATGYDLRGRPVPPDRSEGPLADGGLFATLPDLGRFVAAGMLLPKTDSIHPVITRANIASLYKPQISIPGVFSLVADAYGMGYFTEKLPSGHIAVWHSGQGFGWMTHFHSVPESGDGIVILTNGQRSWPLFVRLTEDWSRWRGFGPVKMSRLILLQAVIRTLIGWGLLALLWSAWRIYRGAQAGTRQPMFGGRVSNGARIGMFTTSLVLLSALLWCANQKYLFVVSLFPNESIWLAASLLLLSLLLIVTALLPVVRKTI